MNQNFTVLDHYLEHYRNYCSTSALSLKNHPTLVHPLFGGCMINEDVGSVFMHIDKCASRSVTAVLEENGFDQITEKENFVLREEFSIFAVVRNPITRWASGLNEYMYRYAVAERGLENPMYDQDIPKDLQLSLDQIEQQVRDGKLIFEEHTAPQYLFLVPCDNFPIELFSMEHALEKKLQDHLGLNFELPFYNAGADRTPCHRDFCDYLFESYVKDSEHFFSLYEKDFEIFEKSR